MELTRLFVRGLRWSYRKYGLRGAAVFALLAVAGYFVAKRRVSRLFGGGDDVPIGESEPEPIDLEVDDDGAEG